MFFVVSGAVTFNLHLNRLSKAKKPRLQKDADFKFTCFLFRLIIRVIIWPFMVSSNFRVICAVFVSFLAKKAARWINQRLKNNQIKKSSKKRTVEWNMFYLEAK